MLKIRMLLCLSLFLAILVGCGGSTDNTGGGADYSSALSNNDSERGGAGGSSGFFNSDGLDENGFWIGLRAQDYVESIKFQSVLDYIIQCEIDRLLEEYSFVQIFDRAVAFGDKVNIDYVGSVDGVEFSGGNSGGRGADVTAGSDEFIDDFLTQIIGRMPGETFDVEVTFPEVYSSEELAGKDAVFVTTINYITETIVPELTDTFIAANLAADFGWTTVDEMRNNLMPTIQESNLQQYVNRYLYNEVNAQSIPEQLIQYQERAMLSYYQESAEAYEMELEDFIGSMVGFASLDELYEFHTSDNYSNAKMSLVIQSVAEEAGLSVSNEDLTNYFMEFDGVGDYSVYEEQFGLPYLKQAVLYEMVINYVVANAIK